MNAEERAKIVSGRECYGKQHADHDKICPVCPIADAIRAAEIAALEEAEEIARHETTAWDGFAGAEGRVGAARMIQSEIRAEVERRKKEEA